MHISFSQSSSFMNYAQLARKAEALFPSLPTETPAIAENEEAAAVEGATLTLAQYKQAFLEKIDAMPIHPSQAGAQQSISIAEALFAKMQADPELEQQVLDQIKADLGANFAVSPAFTTMRFDENGVYSGTAGGSAYMDRFEQESADAFWRRDPSQAEKKAEKRAEEQRKVEKKKKREALEKLLNDLALQRRQHAAAIEEGRLDVTKGIADYVRGPTPVMRPSLLESLL